ncbi:type IV pilus biogenesis protein PilM [Serratia symbiotica]|nr:type IV pilus biogenesis protein PilM [Serratia symbiotica]MBQ0956871.1 type IV pilus biogenesis protein PilM [Serratia symbiotica]QTP13582.1 type IV pilus biogenesis protein PilM [Serratia symbiotica]
MKRLITPCAPLCPQMVMCQTASHCRPGFHKGSGIALRISGDIAYAFRPAVPGLFSQLLQDTENSTHFGLSDPTGITTPTGWQSRPAFIPVGYVVYLRENRC